MDTTSNGYAAEIYTSLLQKKVVIYYTDEHDNSRKLVGTITKIDGDLLWLENANRITGEKWRCAVNIANVRVSLISTVEGWNSSRSEEI